MPTLFFCGCYFDMLRLDFCFLCKALGENSAWESLHLRAQGGFALSGQSHGERHRAFFLRESPFLKGGILWSIFGSELWFLVGVLVLVFVGAVFAPCFGIFLWNGFPKKLSDKFSYCQVSPFLSLSSYSSSLSLPLWWRGGFSFLCFLDAPRGAVASFEDGPLCPAPISFSAFPLPGPVAVYFPLSFSLIFFFSLSLSLACVQPVVKVST